MSRGYMCSHFLKVNTGQKTLVKDAGEDAGKDAWCKDATHYYFIRDDESLTLFR